MSEPKDIIESQEVNNPERIIEDRGHDLGEVMVDVTRRENADGTSNMCLLTYVRPDVHPEKVHESLKETCQNIFGPRRNPEYFDAYYRDPHDVELDSGERGKFHTFDLTIKHPKSQMYQMESLRNKFAKTLKQKLEEKK